MNYANHLCQDDQMEQHVRVHILEKLYKGNDNSGIKVDKFVFKWYF